ncbi:helix-turn-helix transcriptional regulator [Leminorella grimontii]|uniref:helix-turn-helix transcriptional regulator n=1 Tax=Leminorella grimontii TaxID=82981 RepID=UPI002084E2ED|nr:YafY family protein [Leminorella grimontii]GKX57966.1 transcriptional regulator [Leminorella grimontii]
MSRSERLLSLLQLLRNHRYPMSGKALAASLNVSLRTLYRDIRSLQAQGAAIEGEAGVGYVLKEGFLLPPLMFTPQEIEALTLGARWVKERVDDELATAATQALAKIAAVVSPPLRYRLESAPLLIGPSDRTLHCQEMITRLRAAVENERKIEMSYTDKSGRATRRTVWPFAIGFFDDVRLLLAWCELRNEVRNFRVDRLSELRILDERYPRRRQTLLKEWYRHSGITQD